MAVGSSSITKSIAQSSLVVSSFMFATQTTEMLLMAGSAYLDAMRGIGWSPSVDQEARCAARCLRPGQDFVVIDAGANVGNWLKCFRKYVKGNGQMFAFEPQPDAAARIRECSLGRYEVLQVALGENPGKMIFHTSGKIDTMGSLYERHDTLSQGRAYCTMDVEVLRLDDFVQQRKIERIDFMKMDLEGGELAALKGAAECMRTGLLQAFSFEFGISDVNSRVFFRDIFEFLRENQYRLFRITPAGRLIRLNTYTEDYEFFARTTTFLARR